MPCCKIDDIKSHVSASFSDAGYAPTNNFPGITQLDSGVGPQY
jgi:hypothetical protein